MYSEKEFKVLSQEEIQKLAPSIYTEQGSSNTSEKYVHIPTSKVVSDMELLGWEVVDAKEVKVRKQTKAGYQKHLVVFRNQDVSINNGDNDVVFPQILLTNSHNGMNPFTFTAGLFRFICSNGLVISTQEFENVKIRHYGYSFEELQETVKQMVLKLPLTVESMNKMQATELGMDQMLDFAKKALEVRHPVVEGKRIEVDLMELLRPYRDEDKGSSVWKVYNVLQEKITGGDYFYATKKSKRKSRNLKSFTKDMEVNQKLFDLALEYVS
jgi:hypothetical protein